MNKTYVEVNHSAGYPIGDSVFYECGKCGEELSSNPPHAIACKCRNIVVDTDAGRISVKDESQFKVFYTD